MLTLILAKFFSYIIIIIYMLIQDTSLQYMIIRNGQWEKLSLLTLEMELHGNIPHIATAISDWYTDGRYINMQQCIRACEW